MTIAQIRKKYLDYYKKHGHVVIESALLIPDNDPTTLFTGSGMQPMVPYLLGEPHPEGKRIADSQKCFRTVDIEEVGDNRHTTFFEMLGNWSLGDYFKKEQIPWIASFLFDELGLDPQRLYVTCFRGNDELGLPRDEESVNIWRDIYKARGIDATVADFPEEKGLQDARIFYYDESKNWWSRAGIPQNMPAGEPGGPDTEMFWDFTPGNDDVHNASEWSDQPCHVNCDCGRFFEIGNSVFMEYLKTENGFEPLPNKNVDFGGGLERMATAVMDNPDIFMIDAFDAARETVEKLSGKKYGENDGDTQAFRVIMDHMRAATHLIADGAYPSNKDQGYFTRRLVRRAIRWGHRLGIEDLFAKEIANAVADSYANAYPKLKEKKDEIADILDAEEQKFRKALKRGEKELEKVLKKANPDMDNYKELAQIAFDLFQTHGFPLEVFVDAVDVDENKLAAEYDTIFEEHQKVSRKGMEKKFHGGLADHSEMSIKYHTATHLLHQSLKYVLGDQVNQSGSNITPKRLRFDFNHPSALTDEQIAQVEDMVNRTIERDFPVSWQEYTVQEAMDRKAIGLFPERYDAKVKVYTIGDPKHLPSSDIEKDPTYSIEICGGPHVENTGVLGENGTFKIKKEEALGAGLRRIRAVLE